MYFYMPYRLSYGRTAVYPHIPLSSESIKTEIYERRYIYTTVVAFLRMMNRRCLKEAFPCSHDQPSVSSSQPPYHCAILKGDINSDGDVNSVDLSVMSLYLSGRASISREGFLSADMDNDGSVDSIDLVKLRKLIISKDTRNPRYRNKLCSK